MKTKELTRIELENDVCDYFTNKYGWARDRKNLYNTDIYNTPYAVNFEFYIGTDYYKNSDKTFKQLKKHYLTFRNNLSSIKDNKELNKSIQWVALTSNFYDDISNIEAFNKNVCHSVYKIEYSLEHAQSTRDAIKLLDSVYSDMLAKYKKVVSLLPDNYIIVFSPYEYGIPDRAGVFDKKHMILGGIHNPLQYKEIKEFLDAIQKVNNVKSERVNKKRW